MKNTGDLMELVNECGVAQSEKNNKVDGALDTAKLLAETGFCRAAKRVTDKLNPIIKKAEIAAEGYIEITPEKIKEFLKRKADNYNKERKPAKGESDESTWAYGIPDALRGATMTQMRALADYMSRAQAQRTYTTNTTSATDALMNQAAGQIYWTTNATWDDSAQWGGGPVAVQQGPQEIFSAPTKDHMNTAPGTIGKFQWSEVAVADYTEIPPLKVLKKLKDVAAKKLFDFFTVATVKGIPDPLLLGRVNGSTSRYFIDQWGDDVALDDVI